jgi:FlaG/FlaF family flagellin (archaellin)
MRNTNQEAVSPVVGVMLMLVITIIIAAVVSAFAGGLSAGSEKAPNVQIKASYSQAYGITIEHMGGDAIGTQTTTVMVRPSGTFGSAEHQISVVNKSTISNSAGKNWTEPSGVSGVKSFKAGDINFIKPPYHNYQFLQPGASITYRFDNVANIGNTFYLEFADDSGKVFARTEVTISA